MNLHYYFKTNIYVTSSGVFDEPVFHCAKEMIGIENLMFSVDYPFADNVAGTDFLSKLQIDEFEKSTFAGRTACKLLKLNGSEGVVRNVSRFEKFKIRLKSRVGSNLISKLVK